MPDLPLGITSFVVGGPSCCASYAGQEGAASLAATFKRKRRVGGRPAVIQMLAARCSSCSNIA